jgi:hypothetical protein
MEAIGVEIARRMPRNKGNLASQKPPTRLREIWEICIRLQLAGSTHDLAMFNFAIDRRRTASR